MFRRKHFICFIALGLMVFTTLSSRIANNIIRVVTATIKKSMFKGNHSGVVNCLIASDLMDFVDTTHLSVINCLIPSLIKYMLLSAPLHYTKE